MGATVGGRFEKRRARTRPVFEVVLFEENTRAGVHSDGGIHTRKLILTKGPSTILRGRFNGNSLVSIPRDGLKAHPPTVGL